MKVPDDLLHRAFVQDNFADDGNYPLLWTVVVLSPFCALFWVAVIWAIAKLFGS